MSGPPETEVSSVAAMPATAQAAFGHQVVYTTTSHGVTAWLVIDRLRDGLAFGGFRFSGTVSLLEVKRLAWTMSCKLAAHGLPVGGAKAGLCCQPNHPAMDAILGDLANEWREPLQQHVILGKDMGASDALLDRLYAHLGKPQLHLVQAREPTCPNRIRQLNGYVRDMTGLGAIIAAEAAIGSLNGKRVLIQGAGVVGVGIAIRATERGAIVVGMSDIERAVVEANGLPAAEAMIAARDRGQPFTLAWLEKYHELPLKSRNDLLGEPADILFLAAGSHTVSETLADQIQAGLVVEASNFGLTEAGDRRLFARGIRVIPDIIGSSSSAAMVSYQIASGNRWAPAALWRELENNIRTAVSDSLSIASRDKVSVRDAHLSLHTAILSH